MDWEGPLAREINAASDCFTPLFNSAWEDKLQNMQGQKAKKGGVYTDHGNWPVGDHSEKAGVLRPCIFNCMPEHSHGKVECAIPCRSSGLTQTAAAADPDTALANEAWNARRRETLATAAFLLRQCVITNLQERLSIPTSNS